MSTSLQDYRAVVGSEVIDELKIAADQVKDRKIQHINSTFVGGGVAELLARMVLLFRELGIETTWDVIKGEKPFFEVTKAFHNALHGGQETITGAMFDTYPRRPPETSKRLKLSGTSSWFTTRNPPASLSGAVVTAAGSGGVTSTFRHPTRRCGISSNPT